MRANDIPAGAGIFPLNTLANIKIMKNQFPSHTTHSAVYGMGFIGAAIYYIAHAASFWMGALGLLKAILWPAFLVYEA